MQLHQLSRKTALRRGRRVGRGGKRGTYSGRGIKGQRARAGAKIRPAERELMKKIPKLRGYKFKSFRPKSAAVNLGELERVFKPGETVSPKTLLARRLIRRMRGRTPAVKILGEGTLTKKLLFTDVAFSEQAAKKLGVTKE